jgi:DNA polymerase
VAAPDGWPAFRATARALLAAGVIPADVTWSTAECPSLLDAPPPPPAVGPMPAVPRALVEQLAAAACHRTPGRWALMYRVLWRTLDRRRDLHADAADPDVATLARLATAVRHDCHRMHAYVRFRGVADGAGERFVAWYEPEHLILERVAPFFTGRFANMRWLIATPDGALAWDPEARRLAVGPPPPRDGLPDSDGHEALWQTYYAHVFNPARTNPAALARHLPRRVWRLLPEGGELERLLADGAARGARLAVAPPSPPENGLRARAPGRAPAHAPTAASLEGCRQCELHRYATRPVPGEGPRPAAVMLVGEAPGDEEDLAGRPFVGPAGAVLDAALAAAGVDRGTVFVTNAVKHFAWEPRGRRRLHRRPRPDEVHACSPWLAGELGEVRPRVVVALGATALRALAGWTGTVQAARAAPLATPAGVPIVASWHPAAALRAAPAAAARIRADLAADLALAVTRAGAGGAAAVRHPQAVAAQYGPRIASSERDHERP